MQFKLFFLSNDESWSQTSLNWNCIYWRIQYIEQATKTCLTASCLQQLGRHSCLTELPLSGHSWQKGGGTRDGQFGTPCPRSTIIKARRSPLRRPVLRAEEERPAVVVIVLRLLLFHRRIVERGGVSGPLGRRRVAVPGWSARAGRLAGRTLGRPLLGIWVGGRLVAFARRLVALCVLSDRLLVALVIGWAKGWAYGTGCKQKTIKSELISSSISNHIIKY